MRELSEAERHLIAMRRHYEKVCLPINDMLHAPFKAAMEHADKLIAEQSPKLMSAEDLRMAWKVAGGLPHEGFDVMRAQFLANILAVLDKELAKAGYDDAPPFDQHSSGSVRWIIARVLKAAS